MTTKERIHRLVDALPEERLDEALRLIEDMAPEDSGLDAFLALADDIARNASEEDLNRMPVDASENLDRYLYGINRNSGR